MKLYKYLVIYNTRSMNIKNQFCNTVIFSCTIRRSLRNKFNRKNPYCGDSVYVYVRLSSLVLLQRIHLAHGRVQCPRVVTGEKNSPTVAHACRKR